MNEAKQVINFLLDSGVEKDKQIVALRQQLENAQAEIKRLEARLDVPVPKPVEQSPKMDS